MYKFLVTLHVLAAVLVIGPFALGPFAAHRAIRRHDVERTRDAARWMARFGVGSLFVAVLGIGALGSSTRFTFRSPWVIISLTLYIIVMGIATGYTVPAIRRAGSMLEQGVLERPPPAVRGEDETPPPNVAATATDLATKERLDSIAGRVIGSGTLVLLILVVITILMVTRPFGK